MTPLTDVERRVLAFVRGQFVALHACTCTVVGEACLTRHTPHSRRAPRQSFARPAGAVLARLRARGLVVWVPEPSWWRFHHRYEGPGNWEPTASGCLAMGDVGS